MDGEEWWTLRFRVRTGEVKQCVCYVLKCAKRCGSKCKGYEESAEVRRLQGIIEGLIRRVQEQAELLARRAERES